MFVLRDKFQEVDSLNVMATLGAYCSIFHISTTPETGTATFTLEIILTLWAWFTREIGENKGFGNLICIFD